MTRRRNIEHKVDGHRVRERSILVAGGGRRDEPIVKRPAGSAAVQVPAGAAGS